jgi:hypothetical protein
VTGVDIRLRIDRIVLDDAPPGLDPADLTAAVRAELTRLLTDHPVTPAPLAVPVRHAPDLTTGATAELGRRIAAAVHAALPRDAGDVPPVPAPEEAQP